MSEIDDVEWLWFCSCRLQYIAPIIWNFCLKRLVDVGHVPITFHVRMSSYWKCHCYCLKLICCVDQVKHQAKDSPVFILPRTRITEQFKILHSLRKVVCKEIVEH